MWLQCSGEGDCRKPDRNRTPTSIHSAVEHYCSIERRQYLSLDLELVLPRLPYTDSTCNGQPLRARLHSRYHDHKDKLKRCLKHEEASMETARACVEMEDGQADFCHNRYLWSKDFMQYGTGGDLKSMRYIRDDTMGYQLCIDVLYNP
ncbi:uncharacterized protein MYCFIDRAFT_179280 [Pseudocercospora fijiensis CIRAD86]|uniref:Uncharacterized protein n=1 Tax=Pseudocercospora fijiensis (strain CIRAD86) TaxID=383855 RepID=M2YJ92_PSEFD|nr:uncharacterized protein MYCFIDRAFT_179280 [Pseudocercospora fijiensis CIRAD86]EME77790.1 hypothetical protein MYCFIDRAFT_179280 [Pseudocercospora fijiensis CIRAD86]